MVYRFVVILSLYLVAACTGQRTIVEDAHSAADQEVRRVVALCGAGIHDTVANRLVAEITDSSGTVSADIEHEFKAAVPFSGEKSTELYVQFLSCVERERAGTSYQADAIVFSKELIKNIHVLNTEYRRRTELNIWNPNDYIYTYEIIAQNLNEARVFCRFEVRAISRNKLPACMEHSAHIWSERKNIVLSAGQVATLTGSKVVSTASLCWSDVVWVSKVLACWRQ